MKILITMFALFFAACGAKSTPQGNIDEELIPDNLDPDKIYAYDGDQRYLGEVGDYTETFAYVRTTRGYVDMLKYDGLPMTQWHMNVPPNHQQNKSWLFYPARTADRANYYLMVQKNKTIPTKSTFVWARSSTEAPVRSCVQGDILTLAGSQDKNKYFIKFFNGSSETIPAYNYYHHITKGNYDDTYLQYANGRLITDVQAYEISSFGCATNEAIGYPPAVDGHFALKAPITLKKGDGTVVNPNEK